MNTEEKARAYDEALERAKKFHTPDSNNSNLKAVLELIFPQLKESEDERIRIRLLEYFHGFKYSAECPVFWEGLNIDNILAWLEKQKEQKPVVTHGETYRVDTLGTQQVIAGKMPQKPAEWSEEDKDMLNSCISSIEEAKENRYAYKETDGDTSYDHEIAWLKSIRPSWKPSEEQEPEYYQHFDPDC